MTQTELPFVFMRGGTSRGPYFNRADLPEDLDKLARVLAAVIGSGHPLNIDGIGGGNAVTTKVAMLSKSTDDWAEIDYFFAQVSVLDSQVDFKPTCGNILSAVGAAAIEMGLVEPKGDETEIRIHAVNTGAKIRSVVKTPNGKITYAGDTKIDGVPGQAAPVELNFLEVAGSSTGAFLPTGNLIDRFDGVDVTCMDVAMPMVIARASDLGIKGNESREELDKNKALFERTESIRLQAGRAMGLGDCSKSVTPKFGLVSASDTPNSVVARYLMPWTTHPTMAVTGSQCISSCALTKGSVCDGMMNIVGTPPLTVTLEHPMGKMDVIVDYELEGGKFVHKSAGLVRTCRKLAQGSVFVPDFC